MFNKIGAQGLRNIAKREVLRHAENYEREFGVKTEFDERVFTSLLFAEGGSADARTVRSRAEAFFDNELFELFRLVASDPELKAVNKIDRIKFAVELPDPSNPVYSMFETVGRPEVLVFSSDETAALCRKKVNGCLFARVNNPQDADAYLRRHDVKLVLIDLTVGMRVDEGYLNIEDADSEARDFFHHIREKHTALPVYILETSAHTFSSEEKVSFTRQGVRGFLPLSETEDSFFEEFEEIRVKLHHQESMTELAKASKIVTFETSQILSAKGRTAQIKLFDFSLGVAMDAEDSKNIVSGASKPNVRFEDILGADDAKRELEYFVEYLKNPKRYIGTGVRAPKGVLLYGPPGTGKTLLAKAMASKSDVTFICAEGNQFLKRFVGEGPEKVHELFKTARKYAPSILFVDEIDAIAKERSGGADGKGSEETLTAFLTEMDGFRNDTAKPVFVLAATNFNPEPGTDKSLDSALMRRFDRKIYVDLPKRDDRVKYIKLKISKNSAFEISEDKINNLAVRSTGMSLAVLESVLELSLRTVIREGKMKVTDAILEEAFETFNSGEKKTWNADTLERVARHEAGHALVCRHGGDMPSYITVVSRGNHGGYMQHGDNEDKPIYTKEELLSKIRTSLGGRAAEMVCYGNELGISTGASGDLGNATRIAELYLTTYGMDTNFGLSTSKPDSSELRAAVNKILAEQLEKTVEIIERNRDVLDKLTKALVDKNHLAGDEIKAIFANPLV
jgi:ATP-dependent metalloprotease FtsH